MSDDNNIPSTVEEAVNILLSDLSIENKRQIKETNKEDIRSFHFGLGITIRNQFQLWDSGSELLNDLVIIIILSLMMYQKLLSRHSGKDYRNFHHLR